jgi:hypothetical protein
MKLFFLTLNLSYGTLQENQLPPQIIENKTPDKKEKILKYIKNIQIILNLMVVVFFIIVIINNYYRPTQGEPNIKLEPTIKVEPSIIIDNIPENTNVNNPTNIFNLTIDFSKVEKSRPLTWPF